MIGTRRSVVTALGITQILAWGSSYYLLAVLAPPIARDTGWPLPWIVGGLSGGLLVAGLVSPLVGRTVALRGGRPVLAASAALLAIGLTTLGLAPSLPIFLVAWLILGAGMGAGLYDAAFATLGQLYGEAARPTITALTLWGGFASTVCWPLSALLEEQLGWRGACFVYAAIQAVVSLPVILVCLPRAEALQPRAKSAAGGDGRMLPADRLAFGLLMGIAICSGAISSAISVHLLTILQELGLTLAAAVGLGALVGPGQVGARLVEMAGRSRHHPLWTLTAAIGLVAIGLGALWSGTLAPALALILYGGGNGLSSIARGTVPLALFGPARYAALVGTLALPGFLAQSLAPSLAAIVLSRFGATTTLACLALIAAADVAMVGALWAFARGRPGRAAG